MVAPYAEPDPLPQPGVRPAGSSLFQRRIITPLLDLLRVGATPRRLAWSLALGCAVGVNPLLGSTTLVCLLLAWVFRLNQIASQITNHLMYPLEIALFFVFIRMGDAVFHTGQIPLERHALVEAVSHHPIATTRLLWSWEWHALILWAICAAIITPLIAYALTPPLNSLLHSLHNEPVEGK